MSISNHKQLEHTQRQIEKLQFILEEIRREESKSAFAILSQGYIVRLTRLLAITAYLTIAILRVVLKLPACIV